MKEDKRGGKREGAGRKSTGKAKVPVTIYVEEPAIWPFGNKDKLKVALYDFISGYKKPDYGKGNIPLPVDYVEFKSVALLKPDGTTEPLSFDKMKDEIVNKPSYLQLLHGMANIHFGDEKEEYMVKILAADHLPQKQIDSLISNLKMKQ